ncbi:MAG: zinc-ribbon domain containing protein [Candidatus Dormiibacterota bacterium]
MSYQDKVLTCRDCGQQFTFTAGEQEFYASKGLQNEPGRCPDCRAIRRGSRGGAGAGGSASRQMFDVVCSSCGQPTQVPFQPTSGRPVYCSDCFSRLPGRSYR